MENNLSTVKAEFVYVFGRPAHRDGKKGVNQIVSTYIFEIKSKSHVDKRQLSATYSLMMILLFLKHSLELKKTTQLQF